MAKSEKKFLHSEISYQIKAPGFRGAFFLRVHELENELELHGKLELRPLGLSLASAKGRLEYTARSRMTRELVDSLLQGHFRWSDVQPGQYEYFEREGLKEREYHYFLAEAEVLSVSKNHHSWKKIGLSSSGANIAFLDLLQAIFLLPFLLEGQQRVSGILLSGKIRDVVFDPGEEDFELELSWSNQGKWQRAELAFDLEEKVLDRLTYKFPLIGKVELIRNQ